MRRVILRAIGIALFVELFMLYFAADLCAEESKRPELKDICNSVVFLFSEEGSPQLAGQKARPIGTGFIMGLRLKSNPALVFKFVITNAHVVRDLPRLVVRVNNASNNSSTLHSVDLSKSLITPSDHSMDLAAFPLPDIPGNSLTILDYSYVLGDADLARAEVEQGSEVVALEYLEPYAGFGRNFPAMRFGHISLITNEKWWTLNDVDYQQGYVVEIYNAPGSSGSPVVLQPSQIRVNKAGVLENRRIMPFIIGIIKGHPNSSAVLYHDQDGKTREIPNKYASVPAGVAVIEPGDNLQKFLRDIAKLLEQQGHPVILDKAFKD